MPHLRSRHLFRIILKKRKLWSVLGILGPRQVGKSTLLREEVAPKIKGKYISFDRKEFRARAEKSPEYFLKTTREKKDAALILDEVQKVPDIFDAVKAEVDEKRRPGQFILTGSTEFSRRTGIRESLTGRIGLLNLYPLTTRESHERALVIPWVNGKPSTGISPTDIDLWLERGGMPGICFLRSPEERRSLWEGYLDTTCFRDLQQVVGARLSGELAREILHTLAQLEKPSVAEVASKLRVDARRIKKHIEALEAVFLLHRLAPHPSGVGKPLYYLFDAGLAFYLGAPFETRLKIWAINECLAQHEYAGKSRPRVRYYESTKHSHVDFIVEANGQIRAFLLCDQAVPGPYIVRTVEAFLKRVPSAQVQILAPATEIHREGKALVVIPWTMMA
jgi:uncharacterized protein